MYLWQGAPDVSIALTFWVTPARLYRWKLNSLWYRIANITTCCYKKSGISWDVAQVVWNLVGMGCVTLKGPLLAMEWVGVIPNERGKRSHPSFGIRHGYEARGYEAEAKPKLWSKHEAEAEAEAKALNFWKLCLDELFHVEKYCSK